MRKLFVRLLRPPRFSRGALCHLSPHMRRDIGLGPCPQRGCLLLHAPW